jgi:hypothetical protein
MEATSSKSALGVKIAFLAVVGLFLAFPILNDLRPVVAERAPSGMPMAQEAPPFSRQAFLKRSWQKVVETRAKRSSGLWYPLTLFANEIYSRGFGQISAFNVGSVRVGHDNQLFQTAHLSGLNRKRPKNINKLAQRVADIKELQDRLKTFGKSLLIVVTPNMAHLYPELIPAGYLDPAREKRVHPYELVEKAFNEKGVVYVDTVDVLSEAQSKFPFRFFAPSASHWNDVASCLGLHAINTKLREMGGRSFRAFSCDNYTVEPDPRSKDRDLLQIANVLFPKRFHTPTPYVSITYQEPEPAKQPSTLLVGTSYLFALSEHLYDWNLAKTHKLYFYFRQWRSGGEESFHSLSRKSLNWDEVFSNDIIIVNVGVGNPVTIGYGFIEAALAELKQREMSGVLATNQQATTGMKTIQLPSLR